MVNEKQIKKILKATKTEDLNNFKCEIDYFYKLEVKKRNQNKIRKFKVGEKVVFRTPIIPSTSHLPLNMQGTILKLGKTKMKINTEHGLITVPAIRVGRHNAFNDKILKQGLRK